MKRPALYPLEANLHGIHGEHQQLFALVHRYYQGLSGGIGRQALLEILDAVVEAALRHFASEEAFLQAIADPNYDVQRATHEPIAAELIFCRIALLGDRAIEDVNVAHALDALLIHHLRDDAVIGRLSRTRTVWS